MSSKLFAHNYCNQTVPKQINYQYRSGVSFPVALRTLYADGGIPRFYRGVLPVLVQGPLSRFGDTAANTGVLTLLDNLEATRNLNVGFKTVAASASAALFRIFLMPVDTVKVSMSPFMKSTPPPKSENALILPRFCGRPPCKLLENSRRSSTR